MEEVCAGNAYVWGFMFVVRNRLRCDRAGWGSCCSLSVMR